MQANCMLNFMFLHPGWFPGRNGYDGCPTGTLGKATAYIEYQLSALIFSFPPMKLFCKLS